jgi:hypothetical protein
MTTSDQLDELDAFHASLIVVLIEYLTVTRHQQSRPCYQTSKKIISTLDLASR